MHQVSGRLFFPYQIYSFHFILRKKEKEILLLMDSSSGHWIVENIKCWTGKQNCPFWNVFVIVDIPETVGH